eukprot:SAG31_NODE_3098_length_4678_cov_2.509282_2_plen_296_part_00
MLQLPRLPPAKVARAKRPRERRRVLALDACGGKENKDTSAHERSKPQSCTRSGQIGDHSRRLDTQELCHGLETLEKNLQASFARQLGDRSDLRSKSAEPYVRTRRSKYSIPKFTPTADRRGEVMRAQSASEAAREHRLFGRLSKQLAKRGNFEESWHRSQAATMEAAQDAEHKFNVHPSHSRARLYTMALEPRPVRAFARTSHASFLHRDQNRESTLLNHESRSLFQNGSVPPSSRALHREYDKPLRSEGPKSRVCGRDHNSTADGVACDERAAEAGADEIFSDLTRIHRELEML